MNILSILTITGFSYNNIFLFLILLTGIANLIVLLIHLFQTRGRIKLLEEKLIYRSDELTGVIHNLRVSHLQLQQQSDFQKKIIAAIVHGIKSPLKYLSLTGRQLYNRSELQPEVKEVVNGMYTSSLHLYTFTDNLLQYVKVYLLENKPVPVIFNVHELAEEKVSVFNEMAMARGCAIHNHIHPNMQLHTDRQLLSIILHNLLDNAVKYTLEGAVTLSAFITDQRVHIAVQDTGIGMEEGVVEQLYNGHDPESGLGITIARQLLGMIGGELDIRSKAGEGTTAIIVLDQETMSSPK